MSARKLGRLAGLVFVLAAVFGGVGATSGDWHADVAKPSAAEATTLDWHWG
ncbi:hypothetical protein AB0M02_07595 [Actinoplanes sp. NPDC051861]|uniref:hypothetical protein n=1 Tax=Actinoplanes sp. NPDC051861 TaxID=3155170 RepID=UPI003442C777